MSTATTDQSIDLAPATHAPGPIDKTILATFIGIPFLAVIIGVPIALIHGWVTWLDITMMLVLFYVGIHGITLGYHRLFTHNSYRTHGWMRALLAIAGSIAVEGRVVDWVADHRKHHQFSDKEGDPHSPWEFGPGTIGLTKGFIHAHVGWIFTYSGTDTRKYAPDLLAEKAIDRISRWWPAIAFITFAIPAAIGYAVDGWNGALRALFWTGVVRVALVHHLTWSINSVCHIWGKQPFESRDKSTNVAWMFPISGGESWHNYHHADPSSARHGVLPHQWDTTARLIRILEKTGLVWDVKWPTQERIQKKLKKTP